MYCTRIRLAVPIRRLSAPVTCVHTISSPCAYGKATFGAPSQGQGKKELERSSPRIARFSCDVPAHLSRRSKSQPGSFRPVKGGTRERMAQFPSLFRELTNFDDGRFQLMMFRTRVAYTTKHYVSRRGCVLGGLFGPPPPAHCSLRPLLSRLWPWCSLGSDIINTRSFLVYIPFIAISGSLSAFPPRWLPFHSYAFFSQFSSCFFTQQWPYL